MTSTTNNPVLNYYKDKADDMSRQYAKLGDITSNRYGLMIGTLHAIIGYQQKYGPYDHAEVIDTLNKAQAWVEYADKLPRDKWLYYALAREIPFTFMSLWKEYKASGTTDKFMTWWENK